MDWTDTIIVPLAGDKKGKLVIPRIAVVGLSSKIKRDYSGGTATDKEVTVLHLDIKYATQLGIDLTYAQAKDSVVALDLDLDLKIVLALLRGDKAAEVLF